jgi:putative transposase
LNVLRLCELAQMTPQNYYARRHRRSRQAVDLALVLALVQAERAQQPRLGGRKLYHLIAPELKAAGVKLGRDRLFVELGKVGWLVARKPSEWPKTTHFDPNLPVFKNLIRKHLETGPNQVWVADITYIRTREDFMYLGLITDRWSRKIVGYHLGETLATEQVLKALAMADPPLGPRLPVCVARLRGGRAASRPDHEHDRAEPQRGECFGRARQRDTETGVLAGREF